MTSEDPRKKNRRKHERRSKERRVIKHPFASPEWVKAIQQNYLLWPKQDRRVNDRRIDARRKSMRRTKRIDYLSPSENEKKLYDLLSSEEKEMLNELAQSDNSDYGNSQ